MSHFLYICLYIKSNHSSNYSHLGKCCQKTESQISNDVCFKISFLPENKHFYNINKKENLILFPLYSQFFSAIKHINPSILEAMP